MRRPKVIIMVPIWKCVGLTAIWSNFPHVHYLSEGHPKSRRNDGTADGTAISKYIGRGSRRNNNKLDRTTERPTIRENQCSRSAFNCESGDSLLNSSTTVYGIPSGFEYLSGNYRPTVGCLALYIC